MSSASRKSDLDDNTAEKGDPEEIQNLRSQLSRYQDVEGELRDTVRCPVCLRLPRLLPIPVCPNGHVVCQDCDTQLRTEDGYLYHYSDIYYTCPTCRTRMSGGTSVIAGGEMKKFKQKILPEAVNKYIE